MKITTKKISLTLLVLVCIACLTGCWKDEKTKVASQVAAQVGDEEITINQINQILNRSQIENLTPEAQQQVSKEILEKLIEQQLAVNQSIEEKLHRTPEIIALIESSRREIIARAYMQKFADKTLKPTALEIKNYYLQNTQLFSDRRIFKIQELTVLNNKDLTEIFRSYEASAKSIQDTSEWLTKNNTKFNVISTTRAAEQIPLEILRRLQLLKDGQSVVIEIPNRVTLLRIESSEYSPINEETARPLIEKFLMNKKTDEDLKSNIVTLRANTKINYIGQFSSKQFDGLKINPSSSKINPQIIDSKSTIEKGISGLR